MKVNLGNQFEFEAFELERAKEVEQAAAETNRSVYSWRTIGKSNWLEKGLYISDTLGLAILQNNLPDWIDLPDDEEG